MQRWMITILALSALFLSSVSPAQAQTGALAPQHGESNVATSTTQSGVEGKIISNSIGMKLKLIPAGSFQMGSPDTEASRRDDEGPMHKVTISKPFYLGIYEVTQEQWEKVMGSNPSSSKGANKPVTEVSWNDTQEFINKLSKTEKVEYRLPTEAEWEYACRAGTTTAYYWGDRFDARYAWADQNSGGATHDVGTLKPNPWGLFDMNGNVWEWCADWFGTYYLIEYPKGGTGVMKFSSPAKKIQTDPKGASNGENRVLRGGGFFGNMGNYWRSATRLGLPPGSRTPTFGFRLARTQ